MRFIHNNDVSDPCINLAVEEFCLRNLDVTEDYVLFYTNAPSVVIGNHQNPFEECNFTYLQNKNIQLVRRISGGGAVYHDNGNLNFSFITGFEKEKLEYFQKLIQPVLKTLHRLAEDKYKSWDWTFGRSPDFVLSHDIKYDSDQFECVLHVERGVIMEISVQDRTLPGTTFDGLKSKFIGQRYDCIWPFLSFRA